MPRNLEEENLYSISVFDHINLNIKLKSFFQFRCISEIIIAFSSGLHNNIELVSNFIV